MSVNGTDWRPCDGIGERATDYDPVTRTGICPVCRAIRAAIVPADELRLSNALMDAHDVKVIGGDDD